MSSAFFASHCFLTLCFMFSKYVAQFWKFSAYKKGFSIDWDYFCSSQGTFNTQEWIQLKAFSVQRRQPVQDQPIPYRSAFHLPSPSPSTVAFLQGWGREITEGKNEKKNSDPANQGAKAIMMKSNYKYILEILECFFFFWDYVHSFNILFPFHDLNLYLAIRRQLTVKHSCPFENMVVTCCWHEEAMETFSSLLPSLFYT